MASIYKILGQAIPNNTTVDMYTVPSGYRTVISTVTVCNTTSTPTTFSIAARPSTDASVSTKHYIASGVTLAANASLTFTLGLTLDTGGKLSVATPAAGTVAFGAFGTEISV